MDWPFISRQSKKRDQVEVIDLGGRTTKRNRHPAPGRAAELGEFRLFGRANRPSKFSPETLGEHLKNVHRALNGGRARPVCLALGVNETLFRQVELPLMPVADLRQMLKFNGKNYLQQDFPDYVFDCAYYVANASLSKSAEGAKPAGLPQKQKVLVGGAKKELIDQMQAAIKLAGLADDQIVPGVLGPVNAFELAEPEIFAKDTIALVDLGFRNTSITVVDAGELMLNRVVGIGGDRLTQGLADAMGVSYAEAEGIKVGISNEVQPQLEALLGPLGRELRASIDFFEHQRDKTVSQIFVSGAAARNDTIIRSLQAEMILPCKSWNPTRTMSLELTPEKTQELEPLASQLTVAIGVAAAAF